MSGVCLITADINAFEAYSSSAVLPAWRRISQSFEFRFSSNSFLVRRGRRELCKPGSSQSFGRGWLSFATPVLARALFSFTSVSLVMFGSMVCQIRGIPIGGVMSSAAKAVVLGAAELGWLGQHEEHLRSSRRRSGGRMRRVRAARDPQYQQLKEAVKRRERTVELQEQAEVCAQVSFGRSGVIRNEFIPSHCEEFGQCRLVVAFCELLLAIVVE